MPTAITIPGVSIYGANQRRPASGSNAPPIAPAVYNATYLKADPRAARTVPIPKPGAYKSVEGPFSGSAAAKVEFSSDIAPSAYNANYLQSANPAKYPPIHAPLSDQAAFKLLDGAPEDTSKPAAIGPPKRHYTPIEVIEILKLLEKGEISDEQMEAYLVDAERMRVYAVLAKQRALSAEEQQQVDEVGARLAEEARQLVTEDVGFDRAKRGELEALSAVNSNLNAARSDALAAGQEAELRRLEALHEAKTAEGDVAHFEALSQDLDLKIAPLEEEVKQNYPRQTTAKGKAARAILVANKLGPLQADKLKVDNAALAATVAQADFERQAAEAAAQRDAHFDEVKAHDAAIPDAEAALELAQMTDRAVNPRFTAPGSKVNKQAQLTASAIEISQAKPADEDKVADDALAMAKAKGGPVDEFVKFNLTHKTIDKKFFSNNRLIKEWGEYVQNNPAKKMVASR